MTRSLETVAYTTFGELDAIPLCDEPDFRSMLLDDVPELYKAYSASFPARFADKGSDTYSMTFKGNFLSYHPEDQALFKASLFAGSLAIELFQEDIVARFGLRGRSHISGSYARDEDGEITFCPLEPDIEKGFSLSLNIAEFAQEVMAKAGVPMDMTSASVTLSDYDKNIKKRMLLTSDTTDIIIDPMMMICEPSTLSPSGIFRPMNDQLLLKEPRGTGVLYTGLDFKIRQFTLAR